MAATADVPPVALDPEERLDLLLRDLGTRRDGLSALEADRRLAQHGPNELRRRQSSGHLREVWGSDEVRRWAARRYGRV